MAPLGLPEARPDGDTASKDTTGKSEKNGVAVSLVLKDYDKLTTNERALMNKMCEHFIDSVYYRDMVRRQIDPPPPREKNEVFRLMDLPTEIRVMIAKYALKYENGLIWRWMEQPDGRRIGRFCDPRVIDACKGDFGHPVDKLCLSRQLYQETAQMWFTINVLCFDGNHSHLSNYQWTPTIKLALSDWTFFLSHGSAINAIKLDFTIYGHSVEKYPTELLKLSALTMSSLHINLRLIDFGWHVGQRTRRGVLDFMKHGTTNLTSSRLDELVGAERRWRVFPTVFTRYELQVAAQNFSEDEHQLMLDWIENGR